MKVDEELQSKMMEWAKESDEEQEVSIEEPEAMDEQVGVFSIASLGRHNVLFGDENLTIVREYVGCCQSMTSTSKPANG